MTGIADCLKEFRESEDTISGGREFQSLVALRKKEYVKDWLLDYSW